MNKTEYWNAVVRKYPQLADENHKIQLTSRGLKRLVEQAHEEGRKHGVDQAYNLTQAHKAAAQQQMPSNPFEEIFGKGFG